VKVSNRKGIANQSVPESCVAHREVRDEALTGEPAGQPLSRESFKLVQGADVVSVTEGNTDRRVSASGCPTLRGLRTWHAGTLFAREPGDLLLGRLELFQSGPHREDEESKPMTNGQEKSDLFIVAMKLANKPGRPGAESVELCVSSSAKRESCKSWEKGKACS
jgi:RNA-directed DNA polymerase